MALSKYLPCTLKSSVFFFILAPNPIDAASIRLLIICSRPANAPPLMKRIFVVSIWMKSPLGFLRPGSLGTLITFPSTILSNACCTPSPDTSRLILTFPPLLRILSISSIYTMPLWQRSRSCPLSMYNLNRTLSTSSPTYPACVKHVASAITKGTSINFANVFTNSVFPLPVGPMMIMLLLSNSQSSTSGPILWCGLAIDLSLLSSFTSGVSQNGVPTDDDSSEASPSVEGGGGVTIVEDLPN
mmetsp:Transcript_7115/g.16168  ORF Transcript_7115/g.16168 Transcript_7115/m.16168 type:complete len:243 (+) Transcript_7115:611-1339(+)